MSTNIAGDWRELFDVALFEPNRARLPQRIQNAKEAIGNRLDTLMRDVALNNQTENARIVSERIELSDALTTLAELHQIIYARKSSSATKREESSVTDQSDLQ